MSIRTDRVRLAGFLKKKQDLTTEEFLSYWLNNHGKLFSSLDIVKKNLLKYEQCHPSATAAGSLGRYIPLANWDGMVIFEGESYEKIMEVFTSAEYLDTAVPDEKNFLDREATQFLALDIATIHLQNGSQGRTSL
ncbi:hypothetical protein FIBSPDRAFT_318082 [Athelia psychrophila]|uniref:EthD domain-containing protein n=1 Tax=Athelia psychrophila TaxID=1759441 RepID=A0A167WUB5_9AGAM|nr:hypothetical protein FIBSPDRAFT_318082 [Fibularhizoctonia sp. CBS 109695]